MKVTVDHLSLPCDGELENGDTIVTRIGSDCALVAVIDALGHGPVAAEVARHASAYLMEAALESDAGSLMAGLDTHLRGTRGAAVLLCLFRPETLETCTVGNVELRSVGARLPLIPTPGIVGSGYRKLKVYSGAAPRHERFIAYTDGISARFDPTDFGPTAAPIASRAEVCETLMKRLRRAHDDATILVADLENTA